jgi:hypothetical protein
MNCKVVEIDSWNSDAKTYEVHVDDKKVAECASRDWAYRILEGLYTDADRREPKRWQLKVLPGIPLVDLTAKPFTDCFGS